MHQRMLILMAGLGLFAAGCAPQSATQPGSGAGESAAPVATIVQAPELAAQPLASAPAQAPAQDSSAGTGSGAAGNPASSSGSTAAGGDIQTFVLQPDATTASYAVGEILFREGNRFNLAVGKTNATSGQIQLNTKDPSQSIVGPITVDISTLKSDSGRRDSTLRDRFLQSMQFPKATFTSTKIDKFPADPAEGKEVHFEMTGDLTIHEVTRPTTFVVTVTLAGGKLTGSATTTIQVADFGVEPPDMMGMLKAEPTAKIGLDFVAVKQ